jgi:hypothetical protein
MQSATPCAQSHVVNMYSESSSYRTLHFIYELLVHLCFLPAGQYVDLKLSFAAKNFLGDFVITFLYSSHVSYHSFLLP